MAAAWAEPDIAKFCSVPSDCSREAAARWIDGEPARRDAGSALDMAIIELGQPQVIFGEVGITLAEPARRWAEIGFWLFPGVRGEGRASRAVNVFTDWVLREQKLERVFARIHPDNPGSAKVVEKCEYQPAGKLEDGTTVWVFDKPPPLD